jgi:hypothetical protein
MAQYDDLDVPQIAFVGVCAAIITFISIALFQSLYYQMDQHLQAERVINVPNSKAEAALQSQRAKLTRSGWNNDQKTSVSIPIDQAMNRVVQELNEATPAANPVL